MTAPIYDATGARVRHFSKGPARTGKTRQSPEHTLQVAVNNYLKYAAPGMKRTASQAGTNLSIAAAEMAQARGVQRGWPDLQFCINRRLYFIELKAPLTSKPRNPERLGTLDDPGLSVDQVEVLGALHPDCWAICRSVEEVAAALTRWGVNLRASVL